LLNIPISHARLFSPATTVMFSVLNVVGSTSESLASSPASFNVTSYPAGKSENCK